MAPGFDQICMSRPRIIYLDLALPASLPYFGATHRAARRRGWIRVEGAPRIIGGSRRVRRRHRENGELKWKTRKEKEEEEEEERIGGMCQRDTRGTLTLPDYPMNRNVIYGSFSEPEGSA